ncbi:hypothetical protein [Clostridium sp.]|uniref:hypothetical protein n=1 Tax=Clostridium sp. TaxID=1506 RepID=UPI002619BD12|nr:hypothetical protein [Clostridium sp.]
MESQNAKEPKLITHSVKKISNDYLSISVAGNGFFNSHAINTITGEPYNIMFSSKDSFSTSFTTIKIDDINFVYGLIGQMIQEPKEFPEFKNESIYKYRNIEVKQTLQIVKNTFNNYDDGMYKYTVTNNDSISHSVGVRIMIDTMIQDNDGAQLFIPNIGTINNEMDFAGSDIPRYWQVLYSNDNLNTSAKGTLISEVVTTPDRFVIAAWPNIKITTWDYEINNSIAITSDSAVAIYWNSVIIEPGESREFITFYGLNTIENANKFEESNAKNNNINKNSITRGINVFRY